MNITELVSMAQRIHDVEGYNLGTASTRDYRNAFWARVIGCAYHGHPVYNQTPDRQWHLKNGGSGRPQTDDVATSMPSRAYWDCIGGVGLDGYRFGAQGHGEPLPLDQNVYAPPVPAGAGSGGGGTPIEPPPTTPPGLTRAEVQAMIDASIAPLPKYGDRLALRAHAGKVLCAEGGGPTEDGEAFVLTSRSGVGPWEQWTILKG
jgi:hypothetical protein